MPETWSVPPRVLADAVDPRDLVRKSQLDAASTIRGSTDYDDSAGAPSSARAGMLWVPASGKWAPREVLLASDFGVAGGVAELDSSGLLPAARLPAAAVTSDPRAPIGGSSSSTLSVTQTYSIDATGAPVRYFTLTANPTLAVPTNGVDGQTMRLWLLGSGATRTFTFASGYEVSPTVPSRVISIASGTWELIEIERRAGTWRLVRTDQNLHVHSANQPLYYAMTMPSAYTNVTALYNNPAQVASVAIPDPGFPYVLSIAAGVVTRTGTSASQRIDLSLRAGSITGTEIRHVTGQATLPASTFIQVHFSALWPRSGVLTGATTLVLGAGVLTSGVTAQVGGQSGYDPGNCVEVLVIPAAAA